MKSRTVNSVYGTIASCIYYVMYMALGIINRKVLVFFLGIEYQGANGLFSSVLNVLSIAELGIGTAIIFHLYKPLAQGDVRTVGSIMSFYKKCFRYIAGVMLLIGILCSIKLDFFVGENSLPLNLRVVYFLMLADVVASYTFAYKRSILYADQKHYIVSIINCLFVVFVNLFQIGVLYFSKNYYLFLVVKVIFRVVENISLNLVVDRLYPYLKNGTSDPIPEELLEDIKLKVKGLLFHKISTFIVNGTDNVIISKFLGLATVGVFTNYTYIISAINGFTQQISEATSGSIGNLLVIESKEKCHSVFKEMNLINSFITTVAASGVFVLANEFIFLIFHGYALDERVVLWLSINMLFTGQRRIFGAFKAAAGIQYEDRYVPLVESLVNLIFSILLVRVYGVFGVIMGTVISQICDYAYTFPVFVYKKTFAKNYFDYLIYIIPIFFYQIVALFFVRFILQKIVIENAIYSFVLKAMACILINLVAFLAVFGWRKDFIHVIRRINEHTFMRKR